MAALSLEVDSVIVGAPSRAHSIGRVRLELVSERIAVRDLIARTVRAQMADLLERQRLSHEEALAALQRQYLTAADIQAMAQTGCISLHASRPSGAPSPPGPGVVDVEIAKALDGFIGRAFLLLIDGHSVSDLDEDLVLRPSTRITFLRLTPLVGG